MLSLSRGGSIAKMRGKRAGCVAADTARRLRREKGETRAPPSTRRRLWWLSAAKTSSS
jgi:hypothetical protein